MRRKIIYIIIIAIIVLVLIGGGVYLKTQNQTEISTEKEIVVNENPIVDATKNNTVQKTEVNKISNDPWELIQKIISATKAGNLNDVNSLIYKKCDQSSCEGLLSGMYNILNTLNKTDFVTKWEDSKQMILLTAPKQELVNYNTNYSQSLLFFVKTQTGLEFLMMSYKSLPDLTDSDKDGSPDSTENCSNGNPSCQKTNPSNRDTDGDGWWDGIEKYL